MGRTDRILEPIERLSEILFGLIMALTVTGAVSVTTADRLQIRAMVIAALGCNIAWGIIDGGMYLMARLAERGRAGLTAQDFLGAAGVCILVILSTFPVVIPFIFFQDARFALRISNAIAVVSLFLCGFLFGRHAGLQRPWATGLAMVAVGIALVTIAIALGG
jgi:VIT1/CCC1 family predicted Fe2+/Mn2+ transporter